MTQPPDLTTLSAAEEDALISALLARIAALEAENKELREKLDQPPKTPDNSSLPPSRGHNKANRASTARPKAKPQAGSHRALHPEPMSGATCRPRSTPTTGLTSPRSSPTSPG
jgi:transposase